MFNKPMDDKNPSLMALDDLEAFNQGGNNLINELFSKYLTS